MNEESEEFFFVIALCGKEAILINIAEDKYITIKTEDNIREDSLVVMNGNGALSFFDEPKTTIELIRKYTKAKG